jgi:hypothetical protein
MAHVVKRRLFFNATRVNTVSRFPLLTAMNAVAVAALAGGSAAAGPYLRIALEPLALDTSSSTPYVGGYVDRAITAYNAASDAYNRAHNLPAKSPMAAAPIDAGALGLHATLVTFAPGIDVGSDIVRFRAEALIGVADHVHAFGFGVYPLDLTLPMPQVQPYLIGGATLRWLGRSDVDGGVGGLVTFRSAVGARFPRHITAELGVSFYALGGVYSSGTLDSMVHYDPRGNAPPPPPDRAVSGGTQTGMVDISFGFTL